MCCGDGVCVVVMVCGDGVCGVCVVVMVSVVVMAYVLW